MKVRYYIEHLPAHPNPHHPSQRSACHGFARSHHWLRMGENTIVGVASFSGVEHMNKARNHEHVVVLPHLYDKTPVKHHLDKKSAVHSHHKKHFDILKNELGLSETDQTVDLVAKLLAKGHLQFEPDV